MEGDPSKAKKSRAEHPFSRRLPASLVDSDFLDDLHEWGLVSDRPSIHPSEWEEVPRLKPNEMVVFAEQYECGLRFPCSDFFSSVLAYYELEIQHIASNSIVRVAEPPKLT